MKRTLLKTAAALALAALIPLTPVKAASADLKEGQRFALTSFRPMTCTAISTV